MVARIDPGIGQAQGGVPKRDLRLSLPIEESSAGRVRQALRLYLVGQQVTRDVADDVVLATDEACVNVILHADASGRLRVRVHRVDGGLRVEVRDQGCGFAAEAAERHTPVDPLASHGRGLYLITQLMDDVRIESHPGVGTVVDMLKTL